VSKKTRAKPLKERDPFAGLPYGVNALIRNEGSTVEEVSLDDVDVEDDLWRLRPAAHLDLLIESIRMVGQRSPVVLRYKEEEKRWQVVSGFRRVEALRELGRLGVTARMYDEFSAEDAIHTAVLDNFFSTDLTGDHLDKFMERLRNEGVMSEESLEFLDWAREKVGRFAAGGSREVSRDANTDPDDATVTELIDGTFSSLSESAQGLERIFLNWSDVSSADRKLLASEAKYIHDLYPFLTR